MALFLDAAVVLIIVVTSVTGYLRGFVRYVICMLGTLAAVLISVFLSSALTEPVYNRYCREPVCAAIEEVLESVDVTSYVRSELDEQGVGGYLNDDELKRALSAGGDLSENISGMLSDKGADSQICQQIKGELSNFFDEEMIDKVRECYEESGLDKAVGDIELSAEQLQQCVTMLCSDDKTQAADYIEENAAKPVICGIVKIMLFWVLFIAVELLLKLILFISGVFTRLPELNAANRFGGLALGALKGVLYVSLIAFMLNVFVNATYDSMPQFNSKIADSTYIFKYFFDFFYK